MSNLILQQRILNQLWKESGSKPSSENKPRGQSTGGKRPSTKSVKQKRGRGARRGAKPRSFKGTNKPSSSQNISQFGGGVKGKQAATVKTAGAIAVKTGVRSLPFAKAIASSKFLAGANSVPGVALLVGNYYIWKQNIETLKGIYGIDRGNLGRALPPTSQVVNEGQPANFTGGQTYGAPYQARVDFTSLVAGNINNNFQTTRQAGHTTLWWTGRLGGITLVGGEPPNADKDYWQITYTPTEGGQTITELAQAGSKSSEIQLVSISISRRDGQPDTGGNPPNLSDPQSSTGGTSTTVINNYITNNNTTIVKSPTPPKRQSVDTSSSTADKIERVPAQVEPQETSQPESIAGVPPVVVKDPAPSDIKKKPAKVYKKTTRYPTERELQEINRVINENRKKRAIEIDFDADITPISIDGLPSIEESQQRNRDSITDQYKKELEGIDRVVTKTVEPVEITVDTETDTDTNIPPIFPGVFIKPGVKTEQATPTPPTPTKINKCQKGCGGATPTPTPLPPATDNLLSQVTAGLQAVDLGLLTTINTKLGNQIANGGISGGMGRLHKALAVDRWLNLLNTALGFHNAMMLGTNVVDTVVQIFDNVLGSVGIRFTTPDGNSIGFGSVVSGGIRNIATRIVGTRTVAAAQNVFIRFNRFVQVGGNLLSNVRSIVDTSQDIAETTAENVGIIGNALKRTGVVRENSYPTMTEGFDHNSRIHRRLEKIGDSIDIFEDLTSNLLDISEEISDMKTNAEEYQELKEKEIKQKDKEINEVKKAATNVPEPKEEDEARGIEKDGQS